MNTGIQNHIKWRLGSNFIKLIWDNTFDDNLFYVWHIISQEDDYWLDIDIKQQWFRNIPWKTEPYSNGRNISLQIKTTSSLTFQWSEVVYDLKGSNYRTIVDSHRTKWSTKSLLVVVEIPSDLLGAIISRDDDTLLNMKAYRCIPEYNETTYNQTSIRLRFPNTQRFDSNAIHHLYSTLFD